MRFEIDIAEHLNDDWCLECLDTTDDSIKELEDTSGGSGLGYPAFGSNFIEIEDD